MFIAPSKALQATAITGRSSRPWRTVRAALIGTLRAGACSAQDFPSFLLLMPTEEVVSYQLMGALCGINGNHFAGSTANHIESTAKQSIVPLQTQLNTLIIYSNHAPGRTHS
ncbi:MAG: hypothetical protein ACON4T_03715 [Synechococcus sp.]